MSNRSPNQTYLDLQALARAQGRNTQQLFEIYIHERFLARLAASRFAEQLILKGGMLLAALDIRRTTRDGWVLGTVTEVLKAAGGPMQARAIHAAAEVLAGEPVSWSSVKNCLVEGTRGEAPRFERVGRGKYRMRLQGGR